MHLVSEQKVFVTKDIISGVFDAPLDASRDKEYKGATHCLKTIKRMATSTLASHDKAGILKEKSEKEVGMRIKSR